MAADEEADAEKAIEDVAGGDARGVSCSILIGEVEGYDKVARGVFVGGPVARAAVCAPLGEVREEEVVACIVE